jgi:hypothetical protein
MGDGMRALKVAVVVMGVLIVVGTMGLVVGIARRSAAPSVVSAAAWAASVVLDEPAGTRIVGIAVVRDRLAVQLQGGGVRLEAQDSALSRHQQGFESPTGRQGNQ